MKALKGLLIYVGIVLAMILGLGVILFAVMYFVPTFRIMGVGVIHERGSRDKTEIVLSNYSGYDDIELNISSKRISIDIATTTETENINYSLHLSGFGIAYDIVEYRVVNNIEVKDSTLKVNLNITEPDGLITDVNSVFKIVLPATEKYNLMLKTNDGNIDLNGGESKLKVNALSVTTGNGTFRTKGLGTTVGDDTNLILDSLNLSTGIGKINLNSITNLTVNSPIKLTSSAGTFKFNNVNASFNVTGNGVTLVAGSINTDVNGFKFISENGHLDITKLVTPAGAENTIVTENCQVDIDEITGQSAIVNNLGNINLGTVNSSVVLESKHGSVNVSLAKDDIRVETEFGDINVASYLRNGKFESRKGNITVKSTGDYVQGAYTEIRNEDGKINVDNKINKLLVTTTGSSKVNITYREIKGGLTNPAHVFQHKVNLGSNSSAIIYMPTANYNTPFMFKAKGNISGEISGLTTEYEGSEVKSSDDFQFYPSASEDSKAKCMESCYFEFYGTIVFKGYINN